MSRCFACNEEIVGEEPVEQVNCRTGNVWHSHSKDECRRQPVPDSYAATARMMHEIFGSDDVDWDVWKDQMKDGEL